MNHYTQPYDDHDYTEPCWYCGARDVPEPHFGEDHEVDTALITLHAMWHGSSAYQRAIALTLARIITIVSTAHPSRRLNPIWRWRNRQSARG